VDQRSDADHGSVVGGDGDLAARRAIWHSQGKRDRQVPAIASVKFTMPDTATMEPAIKWEALLLNSTSNVYDMNGMIAAIFALTRSSSRFCWDS